MYQTPSPPLSKNSTSLCVHRADLSQLQMTSSVWYSYLYFYFESQYKVVALIVKANVFKKLTFLKIKYYQHNFFQAPFTFNSSHKNPCWTSVNGKLKCLPYFQVIGMDKCGTTDLFARISRHPDVVPNVKNKETMWWSWERYGEFSVMQ